MIKGSSKFIQASKVSNNFNYPVHFLPGDTEDVGPRGITVTEKGRETAGLEQLIMKSLKNVNVETSSRGTSILTGGMYIDFYIDKCCL